MTRRAILLGGLALLVDGCTRRGQQSDDLPPPGAPRPPLKLSVGGWYQIQARDTLAGLSQRSGVPVPRLMTENSMTTVVLTPGSYLWIPGLSKAQVDALTARPAASPNTTEPAPDAFVPAGGYTLLPRSTWTHTPIAGNNRAMGQVTRITLHHTSEHDAFAGLSDVEIIRRIENYHRNERHWAAIGYHFLVGKDGRVYEGRPEKYQGAHVLSENANNLGVSVIGDFHRQLPNQRQLGAVGAFLADMRSRYQVPKTRLYGHRDLNESICPGDALYGWLQKYKRA